MACRNTQRLIGNCGHSVRTAATVRINLELASCLATSLLRERERERERDRCSKTSGGTAVCSRRVVVSVAV